MRVAGARHGNAALRGTEPLPGTGGGRFGRMFPDLNECAAGEDALRALGDGLAQVANPGLEGTIPAGYTYLGQFIDHDITFDPLSRLRHRADLTTLVDFRTPRFDLDSVYGSGPADQPYLYDWEDAEHPGVKLLLGRGEHRRGHARVDLPRNAQGRALIGDGRNDEHLIITQLHLLFLRFHNQVVEELLRRPVRWSDNELLVEAQRLVRWHYQWIVRHDYLPTVMGHELPETFERRFFTWEDRPFIPVEFSGAAFRFGHSMVRDNYRLNDGEVVAAILPPQQLAAADDGTHDLGGFRLLPAPLVIDWKRFFQVDGVPPSMKSMKIDLRLAGPLARLPPDGVALARLNLARGRTFGLPAGRDVAEAMGLQVLDDDRLGQVLAPRVPAGPRREALKQSTPLWFYLLAEALFLGEGGLHLGPVGAAIVAEVLVGLLEGDPRSYVHQQPAWQPEFGDAHERFTMGDLIRFTEHGERRVV